MVDVVVVGAGSAGCALAGRLSDRPGRSVLLLEAGPLAPLPELRDVASLAATAAGHPRNWAHPVRLRPGHAHVLPRGRGLGGSSAVNGAYWIRATPADADGWGVPGWAWADLRPAYVRAETDLDAPAPGHGPVPVRRPAGALLHPAARRFLDAATVLGFPAEPDKNAGGPPGAGPVPSNSIDGVRVDMATAYLSGPRPGLTVRGDAPVGEVRFHGDRACGVRLASGETVDADEVVLAAGAIGTPRLLLRSGIGPGGPRTDLPVGRDWSDHPAVFLPFTCDDPPAHPHAPSAQVALDLDAGADPAGDVEVLAFLRPFVPGGPLHLMCALQQPDSRGTLDAEHVDYEYLRTEHDRRRLRHAIRTAAELLRAGVGTRVEPAGEVLGNDRALDGWIAAHLTTSVHLCGSAALGRVVDPDLRVLGLRGLRLADTSVLPLAPRRGTAATAVAVGERAAELVSG